MTGSQRRLGRSPERRRREVPPLAELQQRYISYHRALGHSEKTVSHYEDSFRLLNCFVHEQQIASVGEMLTGERMAAFARWLQTTATRGWRGETARSAASTHGVMRDMRAFARYLVEEEILERAPRIPMPKLPRLLFPVLTGEQLRAVFATAHLDIRSEAGCRNRALIAFMLDTAVRRSEVASLQLADVDLKNGVAKVRGKGEKERLVFFAPATTALLQRWLAIRGEEPGRLFWLQSEGVRMVIEKVREQAGLTIFHAHALRHTALTMMVRQGVDMHTIKRLAGHASITTTEGYMALSQRDMQAQHRTGSPFEQVQQDIAPVPIRRRLRAS